MKTGFLKVHYDFLHHLLRLPKDVEIVSVGGIDWNNRLRAFSVQLVGGDMPEHLEGELIPFVKAICEKGKEMRFEQ